MHQNSLRSIAYPKALPKLYKRIHIQSSESSVHCQTLLSSTTTQSNPYHALLLLSLTCSLNSATSLTSLQSSVPQILWECPTPLENALHYQPSQNLAPQATW